MLAALYASVQAREIVAHPEERPKEGGGSGGGRGPAAAAATAAAAAAADEPPSHARCSYLRLRRGLPSADPALMPPADDAVCWLHLQPSP